MDETHQGATRKLNSLTSRIEEVCLENACMHDVHITGPLPPPQHNHKGLALCSRCHLAWAAEGTPVGPGKDTHGTLGPERRRGRGWPTPTPKRAKCTCHDAYSRQVFRQTDHQLQVTITNSRRRLSRYQDKFEHAIPVTQQERNVRAAECSCNRVHRFSAS